MKTLTIQTLGASGSGKSTLNLALQCQDIVQGRKTVLDLSHPHIGHEMISDDMIREIFRNGGNIELGCDPGITQVGRALQNRVLRIYQEVRAEGG